MAAGGTATEIELQDEDFTINKEISTDGEHIQVDLDVNTTYDEVVTVSIEEQLPEGTTASQVGFLPNKAPHDSQITDDDTFHLDIRAIPQRAQRVVYGLKDITTEEAEALSTEPRILEVRSPSGEVIDDREDKPDVKTDNADGEGGVPAADHPEEIDRETASEEETAVEEAEPTADETEQTSTAEETQAAPTTDGQGVETALDDETLDEIAERVESRIELDAITETKLSQLQGDVADVRAYLPALEEFLGEAGRADEIVDELEAMREQAEKLEDMPDEVDERIATVDEQIESLQSTADDLESQLETVNEQIEELQAWRENIAGVSERNR
jgi:archaellum component FlaC